MAVDTTYTSANYDAYISAAECDTYISAFDGLRKTDSYDSLTTAQKENLIKYATREANRLTFKGTVAADIVAPEMQWPRSGVYYTNNEDVSSTQIPNFVKRFTAYRVLELIDNQLKSTYTPEQAIKRKKLDSLEVEFQDNKGMKPSKGLIDLPAFKEIKPYVETAGLFAYAVRA